MSASLRNELLLIEEAFVAALSAGDDSLSAFESRWQKLFQQLDDAHNSHVLDSDTADLAYTTSIRLAALAETSVDIVAIQDNITSELVTELNTFMAELSLDDDVTLVRPNHPACKLSLPVSSPPRKRIRACDDTQRPTPSPKRRRSIPPETSAFSPVKPAYSPATNVSASPSVLDEPIPPCPARQSSEHCNLRRKRRLSTADLDPPTKPMKRLYAGPRLHAVSDSYIALRPTASLKVNAERRSPPPSYPTPGPLAALDPVAFFDDPWSSMTNYESVNGGLIASDITSTPWNVTSSSSSSELCELDVFLKSLLQPTLPAIALSVPPSSTFCDPPGGRSPPMDSPTMSTLGSSWCLPDDYRSEDSGSSTSSTPTAPLTPPLLPTMSSPTLAFDDPLSDAYFSLAAFAPPLPNIPPPLNDGFEICHLQEVTGCDSGYPPYLSTLDGLGPVVGFLSADATACMPPSVPRIS